MEIETEYKYLIDREQFSELLSNCDKKYSFSERKLQANYYYDTFDNRLNRAKTTVRIRQHYIDLKLQIKRHRTEKDAMSVSEEYSAKIDILPTTMKIPDVTDIVELKGVLITERTTFTFGSNSTICFDTNMYLGICDYEIEIEVDSKDKNNVVLVTEYLGLTQKSVSSKSTRFFKRLEAMKNG